jgi:uncharacterized spore protein YtfJ
MTKTIEYPEIELSDSELAEIEKISGGCHTGLGFGSGGWSFGHGWGFGGGFGYAFGGVPPVLFSQPQVAVVPVQATAVVEQPVVTGIATTATTCHQTVGVALV